MSRPLGYSSLQIRLHWAVAILVILQLIFGEGIGEDFDAMLDSGMAHYSAQSVAHIVSGLLILALVLWRLSLRLTRGVPEASAGLTGRAAGLTHWAFYLVLLVAPLVGLVAWFGGIETAGDLHSLVKPVLIVLITLHVLGALWHQFVLKDGLLLRMKRPG